MSHYRKINKAKKLSDISRYPSTWAAIIGRIPTELIKQLTAKQIATVVHLISASHIRGEIKGAIELADHHNIAGCPWGARIKQIETKEVAQ